MEAKRLTAEKASTSELATGRFVKKSGFESSYVLTKLGRKLSRVRVTGVIVDKFVSQDEKYATITLDDGKDTMRFKAFINVKIFENLSPGDLVDAFGKVREYNGEVYVMPEILRKVDANFETLRMLELEEIRIDQIKKIKLVREEKKKTTDMKELAKILEGAVTKEEIAGILEAEELGEMEVEEQTHKNVNNKENILKLIASLDPGQGIEYHKIITESKLPENVVDMIIQELLEDGICFEPLPGKIKKL
jgi:RPA family protein